MSEGSRLISSAILGLDFETIEVNGMAYILKPPTIGRLAGVGLALGDLGEGSTIADVIKTCTTGAEGAARALSWLIQGDDSLTEKLSQGTLEEVLNGLEKALSGVSIANFQRLLVLARNVAGLIAKPKS